MAVKYFFLSEGWTVGRVWELGGLWSATRAPEIHGMNLFLEEGGERLWLYRVEAAVLMLEVRPPQRTGNCGIGQVVLKRLIDGDRALERLASTNITPAAVAPLPQLVTSGRPG